MTKNKRVLSWDVGIINMAYCLLERDETGAVQIHAWDMLDLSGRDSNNKKKKLPTLDKIRCDLMVQLEGLRRRGILEGVDEVIIENQPAQRMKILAGCLYDYFFIRGCVDRGTNAVKVSFVSARIKLNDCCKADVATYTLRKKTAVRNCQALVTACPSYLTLWDRHKKKDDLSDAMLQGYRYLEGQGLKVCEGLVGYTENGIVDITDAGVPEGCGGSDECAQDGKAVHDNTAGCG